MTNGASASGGPITIPGMLRLWTITEAFGETKNVIMAQLRNPHPGEILKEEFLNEIGQTIESDAGRFITSPTARIFSTRAAISSWTLSAKALNSGTKSR
jgi:hypothetical protein